MDVCCYILLFLVVGVSSVSAFSVATPGRRCRMHRGRPFQAASAGTSEIPTGGSWRSSIATIDDLSSPDDPIATAQNLCSQRSRAPDTTRGESGLAFLFVSQRCASFFADIVQAARDALGEDTVLLSVVGGGVIGGGVEMDDPNSAAISLLTGVLPVTAGVELLSFGPDDVIPPKDSPIWKAIARNEDIPSYVVFADPWSPGVKVLEGLDRSGKSSDKEEGTAIVVGGISVPSFERQYLPTLAVNGKCVPRGSVVGIGLSGSIGLQAVVAQGCRPVGGPLMVTKSEDNWVVELDDIPAMEKLVEVTEQADARDKALIEKSGLLVGIAPSSAITDVESGDYLIRQIMGFREGAVMLGMPSVSKGDAIRFHVRDEDAAREDINTMVGKAKANRMFAGRDAGTPLAALQVSCVARGRSLFRDAGVDLGMVEQLIPCGSDGENSPVAGAFANGELGPAGVAGVGLGAKKTEMHGFTNVAAVFCEFPDSSSPEGDISSAINDDVWG